MAGSSEASAAGNASFREVRFEYSRNLPAILADLNVTLLVTTYQAGKLVVVGADNGRLALSFANFDRPMGIAAGAGGIAVGTKNQVWFLRRTPDIAARLAPAGAHDDCYLARRSLFTGEIAGHEIAWCGDELWVVNTLFSCLCTLDGEHSFVPQWRPPFISALAAEDRCHLNGLAVAGGRPAYVTALAETDTREGWRADKNNTGCVIDVASGEVIARSLAMPHSPRVAGDRLWLPDSGRGALLTLPLSGGTPTTVAQLPGYTRGLALAGPLAFVGLSKIRETAVFGGVPIAEKRDQLKCGVAAVDVRSGAIIAMLEFVTGVEEIFGVALVAGARNAAVRGPFPEEDQQPAVWVRATNGTRASTISVPSLFQSSMPLAACKLLRRTPQRRASH